MGARVCCVHRENDPFLHFIRPNRNDATTKCLCKHKLDATDIAKPSISPSDSLRQGNGVSSDASLRLNASSETPVQDSALPPLLYAYSLNHDMSPRDRLRLLGVRNSILNGLADLESGQYPSSLRNDERKKNSTQNIKNENVMSDHDINTPPILYGESAMLTKSEVEQNTPCTQEFSFVLDPIVQIKVPPGDCGIVFNTSGNAAHLLGPPKVIGFKSMPDGSKGVIERSGLVHLGAHLISVDNRDLSVLTVAEAGQVIQRSAHALRKFVFTP
ncbi:unnamed protein product [Albugo candida]|uniref:PDZ domain-containing protein n=1 Tax=Albugo candida TaxID=65357 RepID=A0A024GQT8_9STRA|nr:unnamed protein product [Albugo candida]|eukprot:CCI49152.1 unnamed protein product [Albugo candida]